MSEHQDFENFKILSVDAVDCHSKIYETEWDTR